MLMRLCLAALLWVMPAAAWADPFTIVGLAVAGLQAAGVITAVTAFYISVGLAVFGAANARRQARKAAARARAEYNAGLSDRGVSALTGEPPFRAIYGRCITGGDILAVLTSDKQGTRDDGTAYTKHDALKHLVITFASREVQAIHEVYIDGQPVGALDAGGWAAAGNFSRTPPVSRTAAFTGSITIDNEITEVLAIDDPNGTADSGIISFTGALSNGNKTLTLTPGDAPAVVNYTVSPAASAVRISKHLGTPDQAADAYLRSVLPDAWSADHRLRGRAYIVITLDMDAEPRFQGGPPNITADISGHKLYDPRKDGSRTGSGAHRLTDTSTWEWSDNPALVIADWLASPLGYEVDPDDDIDAAYVMAAANACEASIDLTVGATTTAGPTYTCNGAFTSQASKEAVLEDLCECMAGYAVYGASWMLIAGTWTAPVLALNDDDLDGQIEVTQAGAGMDSIFNGVRGTYIAAGKATPADFVPYQNTTFVTADGRPLWSDISLPYTDNPARCHNLARIFTERARDSQVIRYPAKLRAWPLQVGDRVTVTSGEYGFAAKTYRVTDWQFGVTSPVLLTLQEDSAAAYDLADATVADPSPNTTLPDPNVVAPLTVTDPPESGTAHLLRMADGTIVPRVYVQWAPVTDAYVADGTGRIEMLWRLYDGIDWTLITTPGSSTNAYISGVREFDRIVIELRAVNGIGARSDSVFLAHTVVGKSQPPVDVAGFTHQVVQGGVRLGWTPNTEADYADTELHVEATWADATAPLFRGSASTYTWPYPALGTYTVLAKHRDSSGNLSTTAASRTVVVDAAMLVQWANVTGAGRPADNATVGATTGTDLRDEGGTVLPGSAVKNNFVTISANGTLNGAGGGQVTLGGLGAGALALLNEVASGNLATSLRDRIDLIEPLVIDTDFALTELQRVEVQKLDPLVVDTTRFNGDVTRLAEAVTNLALKADKVDGVMRDAGIFVDPVNGQVTISAVEQTREALSQVQILLDAQAASISLRATVAYVDQQIAEAVLDPSALPVFTSLDIRLTAAEVDIDGLAASILLKADSTTVSSQGARLTTAEADIDGLEGQIVLKASTTTVNAIDARLVTAENTLVANGDQAQSIRNLVATTFRLDQAAAEEAGNSLAAILAAHAAGESAQTAVALFREEITAKVNTDISAEVTARTQLGARVGSAEAQIVTEQTVRAEADAVMAALITTLQAAVAGNTAAISTEASTRAAADTSLASLITALTATVGTNTAAISSEATTRASADTALAALITAVQALADTNAAQILTEQTARATADGALTQTTQSLTASNFQREREGSVDAANTLAAMVAQHEADTGTRGALAMAREELTGKINGDISAEASRRLELTARVSTTEAGLVSEQLVRATADSALASSVTGLTATVGANQSSAQTQLDTLATQQSATAAAVTTVQSRIALRPNLARNGGFERGLEDLGGNLTGWYAQNDVWGRVGYLASPGASGEIFWPAFPVEPGATYTITGDSALVGGSGQVYFELAWLNAGGSVIGYGGATPLVGAHGFDDSGANRVAHQVAAVVPGGAASARPRFVWGSVSGASLLGCRRVKAERGGLPASLYTAEQESAEQAGILASVRTTANTAASNLSALASTVTTVQADLTAVGAGLAAVEDVASASASAVSGLQAQRTIKTVTRTADGKEAIAGIGLASSALGGVSQSEILLFADQITAILGSDPNGPTQTLFTTGFINGVAALILRAAWIGDLTVETLKIAEDAVTEVHLAQVPSIDVAEVKHVPDGYPYNTVVASYTWTPTVSGTVLVSVTGQLDYTAPAAGGEAAFYSSIQKTDESFSNFARTNNYMRLPSTSSTVSIDLAKSRRLTVTAGVSTTIVYCAAKFESGATATCRNVEMRIEHLKR